MHNKKRQQYLLRSGELKRKELASQTRGRGTLPQRSLGPLSFLSLRLSAAAWSVLQSGALDTKSRRGRHGWRHVSHTEWLIAAAAAADCSREGTKQLKAQSILAHRAFKWAPRLRFNLPKTAKLFIIVLGGKLVLSSGSMGIALNGTCVFSEKSKMFLSPKFKLAAKRQIFHFIWQSCRPSAVKVIAILAGGPV